MAEYDYTEANLTAIINAQIAFLTGTRKVRLSMGDKSIEYAVAKMEDLERMEAKIRNALQAATKTRYFLTSTSKGL